jgi:hypothetical protein
MSLAILCATHLALLPPSSLSLAPRNLSRR